MTEMVAPLETDSEELHQQAIRAAEFLYCEAVSQLKINLHNEEAAEIQEVALATILSQEKCCPDHVILSSLLQNFRRAEQLRSLEMEYSTILLGTVGLDNVGKALVSDYLRTKYGFSAHPLSDQLKDIAVMLGYHPPYDRDTLYHVSKLIKSILGDAVLVQFAEYLFYKVDQPNRILFDGIRLPQEAVTLINKESANSTRAAIIAVVTGEQDEEADLLERYRRSRTRKSAKDPVTFEEFRITSMRESSGIVQAMKYATVTIVNKRDQEAETYSQVDEAMKRLLIAPTN